MEGSVERSANPNLLNWRCRCRMFRTSSGQSANPNLLNSIVTPICAGCGSGQSANPNLLNFTLAKRLST